jgi:glycine C-acetyltransferase
MAEEPQRRQKLWDNQRYFIERIRPLGYQLLSTETAIVPVLIGDTELCVRYVNVLREECVHVDSVQFPAVPLGQARLRFMMNAAHTKTQIDHAIAVMESIGAKAVS